MQKHKEIQQELKRMREICDKEVIVISDVSSKSKKKREIITISDSSHSSKREQKEKKFEDSRNHKNSQIFKDILEIETQKAASLREKPTPKSEKSENWLNYQSKVDILLINCVISLNFSALFLERLRRKTRKKREKDPINRNTLIKCIFLCTQGPILSKGWLVFLRNFASFIKF